MTLHADDNAVSLLSMAMTTKLRKMRTKGRAGWDSESCSQQHLSNLLRAAVEKGDTVDVANYCAFLLARVESILPAEQPKPVASGGWMEQLGFEVRQYDDMLRIVVDDCGNEREATLTERVLWDALMAASAEFAEAPQAPAAPSAVATQVVESLLQLARIVNTAVEDWGETKEDDTLHVIFHKEQADKLEEILDFLDSLPDAPPEEGVILSGPSRAARVLRAMAAPAAPDEVLCYIRHGATLPERHGFEVCRATDAGAMAVMGDGRAHPMPAVTPAEFAADIGQMLAAPAAPSASEVVAGALFDFLGYLTTLPKASPVTFSSSHEATPAVEHLRTWAGSRNLQLEPADVSGWSHRLAAPAAPAVDAELLELAQAIVKFNREHGSVLAVHIDNLAELVDERAAQAAAKEAAS